MNIWDAIILGVIQGLTEFLPISSSGHLVISEHLLGIETPGVSLEIWLHLGTLLAVIIYFSKKIIALGGSIIGRENGNDKKANLRLIGAIILGTVPAVIIGLSLKSYIESAFASVHFSSAMLIVTGLILLSSNLAKNKKLDVNLPRGLIIGVAQALAILPGISRSGSTITCGMLLGVKPSEAAEFSFLLAIPAIGGAFLLDLISNGEQFLGGDNLSLYILGAFVSFLAGIVSIHYLLKLIRRGKFYIFGFYCLVVGIISYIFIG